MSIGETLRMFFVLAARVVLYLPLLALRALARLALVAATVAPIALPVAVVWLLYHHWPEARIAEFFQENYPLAKAVVFLIAVGVVGTLLQSMAKLAWAAFVPLAKAVGDVFRSGWSPSPVVLESLAATWRDSIARIPGSLLLTLARAAHLALMLAVFAILVAAALPLYDPPTVDRYVVVVGAEGAEDEGAKGKPKAGTDAALPPADGDEPAGEEGACLDKTRQAWLRAFRESIADCARSKGPGWPGKQLPTFEVTAFAGGSGQRSCEIANRCADEVAAFLADEGRPKDEASGTPSETACAGGTHFRSGSYDDVRFEVQVNKWGGPAWMRSGKLAAGGVFPDGRRTGTRTFNRSVHITVPVGFCGADERGEPEPPPASPRHHERNTPDADSPSPPPTGRAEGIDREAPPPRPSDANGGIE